MHRTSNADAGRISERIRDFLDTRRPSTPCLVIDLESVKIRYQELARAFPGTRIYYSVKANPAPEIICLLAAMGAAFDVASPAEISLCLAQGATPESLSYGNTIKKPSDIAFAHQNGVTMFATDSMSDIEAIAEQAPGSRVFCRVMVWQEGATFPFGPKFGCSPETAIILIEKCVAMGLQPLGISFHVGSQQTNPLAWEPGIAIAAKIGEQLAGRGVELAELNLGGGLPASYREEVPGSSVFASEISAAVARHFMRPPRLVIEPGRAIVADSGVIRSEVVLVTRKSESDGHRWVYLDVGRHNGMAETIDEATAFRLATCHDDNEPTGPVILAGPTCDGCDVLYENTPYDLPLALQVGDYVDILSAGAYTSAFSTVFFNGFPPLRTYCLGLAT